MSSISIPSSIEERRKHWFQLGDGLNYELVVDGMGHEINLCSDEYIKKSTFSGKKKYNTFTKLIAVTKEGFIWFISKSYPGSINDINLCNFPSNQIYKYLSPDEKIAGDEGFKGLEHFSIMTQLQAFSK